MKKIAIIGQGYVGLPLAIEFSKYYPVIGFDNNMNRVDELNNAFDRTREVDSQHIKDAIELAEQTNFGKGYKASYDIKSISDAQIYIVTVPTPIDRYKAPDLTFLLQASQMVGEIINSGDIIIYESTVYPGCTEEDCIPVLEQHSGLKYNVDFFVGYSPERIVPGDKVNTLTSIQKVTSGSTTEIAEEIDRLYRTIIRAGTFKAASIKVAEASKAIENAQRDVNISFINELALIFDRMGIDTNDVLAAAETKFNFLKFKPGLVGGHCISVDPYYLAHKAVELGYHPNVILSGRRVNDSVAEFVASKLVKLMIEKDIKIKGAKALILGVAFKENCADFRNSKVVDVCRELQEYGLSVEVYDPLVDTEEVRKEYNMNCISKLQVTSQYDAIIITIAHNEFLNLDFSSIKREKSVVFDLKGCLNKSLVDARL